MLIYRIENSADEGPYSAITSDWFCTLLATDQDGQKHKPPRHDISLWFAFQKQQKPMEEFHFGFKDIQQFQTWVYEKCWIDDLIEKGFRLVELEIHHAHVLIGDSQVMFVMDEADFVRKVDMYNPQ